VLTDFAHILSWIVYWAGVIGGLIVLRHLIKQWRRPFVRILFQGIYLGVLLAPVATDTERLYFAPALMKMTMSILSADFESATQAIISLIGMTLLAILITSAYYVVVKYKKRSA
jgi:hypothetical protein